MKFGHKMTAVACAGALAMMGVVPAFADVNKDGDTADVKISAAVAKEGEKIISVTMPSQMAVAITTDASTGKFSSATGSEAEVKNNDVSNADVKIEIAKVSQVAGLDSNAKLLDLVDVKLIGEDTDGIVLTEGDKAAGTDVLYSRLADGGSFTLKLSADKNTANGVIPTDSFTVNTTLKVTALDEVVAP